MTNFGNAIKTPEQVEHTLDLTEGLGFPTTDTMREHEYKNALSNVAWWYGENWETDADVLHALLDPDINAHLAEDADWLDYQSTRESDRPV